MVERIADVLVAQVVGEIVKVVQIPSQERMQQCTVGAHRRRSSVAGTCPSQFLLGLSEKMDVSVPQAAGSVEQIVDVPVFSLSGTNGGSRD